MRACCIATDASSPRPEWVIFTLGIYVSFRSWLCENVYGAKIVRILFPHAAGTRPLRGQLALTFGTNERQAGSALQTELGVRWIIGAVPRDPRLAVFAARALQRSRMAF